MSDERTPLLESANALFYETDNNEGGDLHSQFCKLIGTRPLHALADQHHTPHPESLYSRAVKHHRNQNISYMFTSTLINTLLLSQVLLGATLTGLGASNSSHILITCFGALNTVIAGLLAFLKSRGQPMRARMFRDDLERVVDEIENSAVMWLGISRGSHGYDAIDIDDQVTVRGEVARLTRLYDKAVKTSTLNDPDMYSTGAPGDPHSAALKDKGSAPAPDPASAPAASSSAAPTAAAAPAPPPVVENPDDSPASKPPEPAKPDVPAPPATTTAAPPADSKATEASKDAPAKTTDDKPAATDSKAAPQTQSATPAPPPPPPVETTDPDDSPATKAVVVKHTESAAK